jgi:hypothetical protein
VTGIEPLRRTTTATSLKNNELFVLCYCWRRRRENRVCSNSSWFCCSIFKIIKFNDFFYFYTYFYFSMLIFYFSFADGYFSIVECRFFRCHRTQWNIIQKCDVYLIFLVKIIIILSPGVITVIIRLRCTKREC